MEIRKMVAMSSPSGKSTRECIYFTVEYNHYRDVSDSKTSGILDREEIQTCECVLCLPESYTADGEETPLILSFHGAGGRVCCEDHLVGGVDSVQNLIDAGYAALDVCGSETHGVTLGCPEHIFAAYKAYRYAIKHYNLSDKVHVFGVSMGGQVAMNFTNTFPSAVWTVGMFFPRLNIEGITVEDRYCIGIWDKTYPAGDCPTVTDLIRKIYRFKGSQWSNETTNGFNPYRTRSFRNESGERVLIPPCPIKIWQGTDDLVVDPLITEEFVRSVRRSGSYIELHMMEGVGHCFTPEMCTELLYWFNRFR